MSYDAGFVFHDHAKRAGWNEGSQIYILLAYISNQDDPASFEDFVRQKADEEIEDAQQLAVRDSHSVNCYFCGNEFDEREGLPADPYNNNDGGDICPACIRSRLEG